MPNAWIDRLFERFLAFYGERFTRQWSVVDPAVMKATWARELADISPDELRRGVGALGSMEWPPSLPEFRNACRPPLDYEKAFNEAALKFGRRDYSNPAIYWAALAVGSDVRVLPYAKLRARWVAALDEAMANPRAMPEQNAPALERRDLWMTSEAKEAADRVLAAYRK